MLKAVVVSHLGNKELVVLFTADWQFGLWLFNSTHHHPIGRLELEHLAPLATSTTHKWRTQPIPFFYYFSGIQYIQWMCAGFKYNRWRFSGVFHRPPISVGGFFHSVFLGWFRIGKIFLVLIGRTSWFFRYLVNEVEEVLAHSRSSLWWVSSAMRPYSCRSSLLLFMLCLLPRMLLLTQLLILFFSHTFFLMFPSSLFFSSPPHRRPLTISPTDDPLHNSQVMCCLIKRPQQTCLFNVSQDCWL